MSELADRLRQSRPQGFAVWPENMAIVDAWMIVNTQWNALSLPNGQVLWLGLRYGDVKVSLGEAHIALTPEQWSRLRLMERVAAATLNGKR